jgi:S-(hydroxymethyl)glutathione dehydrogenase/alcohol dehydrogenase
VEVGDQVRSVGVGDTVLLNWAPACRACWWCEHGEPFLCANAGNAGAQPYAELDDGTPVYPGLGVAAFATQTLVEEHACIVIPADVDREVAALLGCAVITGVGAVRHAAGVRAGDSVVVIGLGGVGLSAVQGARLAGAAPIIAVDGAVEKRELALRVGATDALEPGPELSRAVRALTGGRGADHAIECVGRAETIRTALSVTRRGGHATVVGLGSKTEAVSLTAFEVAWFARTLQGSMYGSADPAVDIPELVEQVRDGRLSLDAMITRRIVLDDVEDAFADMSSGRGARSLVVFSGGDS